MFCFYSVPRCFRFFFTKKQSKTPNWRFLWIFRSKSGDSVKIWQFRDFSHFPRRCQMFQIQNHQKLVKNAIIGNFGGKFTSKSGNALKSGNFNNFLRQIVTTFFIVLSMKIQCCQVIQIKNCQNRRKLCKNANMW